MIYTFTIENDFFDDFRDKLNVKDARTVIDFISSNFINRENFFLNAERKKIFNQKTNGGNGNQLKVLLNKLGKKIKNFSNKDNTDFIFSNIEGSKSNVISTNKIISDKYIEIENYLDENFKPFWKYTTKENNQNNKRELEKSLTRLFNVCDEVYFVDRHIPRTLCQFENTKKSFENKLTNLKLRFDNNKISEQKYNSELYKIKNDLKFHESYYNSYNNSFEFFNKIIKETSSINNRFFCGLLKKDLKLLIDDNTNTDRPYKEIEDELKTTLEKVLNESFKKFDKNKLIVHVKSSHQAYQNKTSYRRQLVGIVKDDLLAMIKTDKGLNFLDDNFQLQTDELSQVKPELAFEDWEKWKVDVKRQPDMVKIVLNQ